MSIPTSGSVRWSIAAALALGQQPAPPPPPIAIVGATVIAGDGQPAQPNATIVIVGRRIRALGPAKTVAVPRNAVVVDGRGKFVVPGLWDAHVHLAVFPVSGLGRTASLAENGDYFLPLFIANGITAVRDMSGDIDVLRGWRTEIERGTRPGPRLFITGRKVGSGQPIVPGGSSAFETHADRERLVSLLAERGADFVKAEALDLATLTDLAAIAKAHHLPLTGHLASYVTLAEGARAGLSTVEHLHGAVVGCSSEEDRLVGRARSDRGLWGRLLIRLGIWNLRERERGRTTRALATQDPARCEALARALIAAGTAVTPTLVGLRAVKGLQLPNPPEVESLVPPGIRQHGGEPPIGGDFEGSVDDVQRQILRRFEAAGVSVLAGTDLPGARIGRVPGVSLIEELELLVDAGLTPLEALGAATAAPSRALGVSDSLGTLAVGKIADLVLVDRDPLAAIGNLRSVAAVIVGGRLLSRSELDRLVAAVRDRIGRWDREAAEGKR